jgi:hypothetical protein
MILQVDMVDRKIRMISIDCSLDIERIAVQPSRADQIFQPVAGFNQTVIM